MVETKVLLVDRGNYLFIKDHKQYDSLIYKELSYVHKQYDVNYAHMIMLRKTCYEEIDVKNEKIIVTPSGFLDRIKELFERNNIKYEYQKQGDFHDCVAEYTDESLLGNITLRGKQIQCLKQILTNRRGIIKAPVGFGKSFLFPVLARLASSAKIDIVVKRKDIAQAIYKDCKSFCIPVGLVTSGKKQKQRVTIYTAGSLGHSDYDANLVLVDECHELATDRYLSYLLRYKKANIFGFSATPFTRFDNEGFVLEGVFGKVIYESTYNDNVSVKSVVPIVIRWIPVSYHQKYSNIKHEAIYKKIFIWNNINRNRKIAQVADEYLNQGKQVLIITETVEHALRLKALLPRFTLCTGAVSATKIKRFKAQGLPVDSLNVAGRSELYDDFKSRRLMGVIATDVWSTGVSFDDLDVLVRADARASGTISTQVPGRVSRIPKLTDKEVGIVVDFADIFDTKLYNRSLSRFRIYKQLGWIQCDALLHPITKLSDLKNPSIFTQL